MNTQTTYNPIFKRAHDILKDNIDNPEWEALCVLIRTTPPGFELDMIVAVAEELERLHLEGGK